jgi:hypothetical protein
MATPQSTIQNTGRKAEHSLGNTREMIEDSVGKENVDAVLSFLAPVGDFSLKAFRTTIDYSRRHPIRMAISVLAVGALGAWLAKPRAQPVLH